MSPPFLTDANGSKQFRAKSGEAKRLINEALVFLHRCGTPIERETPRGMEGIALAFLAVADVRPGHGWASLKTRADGRTMKTRDIIAYANAHFGESISPGSYDDIRRRFLKWPVMAGVVVQTSPGSARNDPSRGYALDEGFGIVARLIGADGYDSGLESLMAGRATLRTAIAQPRAVATMAVTLSDGTSLGLTPGEHNELQKAIIEQFLPRYGYGATALYVGDAADKMLYLDRLTLEELRFPIPGHGELPDVVAHSVTKGWLYLIEAFHSTGPMSPERVMALKELTKDCAAPVIYVTAFLTRAAFRAHAHEIAWETEVWIAADPDHLIHFNGNRFLGPHP